MLRALEHFLSEDMVGRLTADAEAITRLLVRGILTNEEAERARIRLAKTIEDLIQGRLDAIKEVA